MKTWKQIEASRERRLWIKEVVAPIVVGTAIVAYAFKDVIGAKAKKFGEKFKEKKDRFVRHFKRKKNCFVRHFKKKEEHKEPKNADENTYDATL